MLMLTSVGTMNISDRSFNDIFECIHIFKLEETLTIALMTQVSKTLLPYFFSVKILQYFLFFVYAEIRLILIVNIKLEQNKKFYNCLEKYFIWKSNNVSSFCLPIWTRHWFENEWITKARRKYESKWKRNKNKQIEVFGNPLIKSIKVIHGRSNIFQLQKYSLEYAI